MTPAFFVYKALKRPATLKVNLLKTEKRKTNSYKGVLNLKSSLFTGSIVSTIGRKPNGFTSIISKIDYSVPKVARNTINLSGKFNDRSTKSYKSYILQSTVSVKKNPEYNSNLKMEIGHKKKLSLVTMDLKYGPSPKDKTKRVNFLASLNRKIATLKNAVINYKVKAQSPAHEIDVLLQGKHQHSPKLIDSDAKLSYAPGKEIKAEITLRDRSTKLAKMNGRTVVSWPGKEYILTSDLSQKSDKQYAHSLNFKSNSGTRHTLSTTYKMPKSDSHALVASIKLHKMKPVVLSGSTNLNSKNFAASGKVNYGKDIYGLNTNYKISKAPSAKFGLEVIHPARRMTLDVSGGKARTKYEGKVEAAWDVDNNKDNKITLEGSSFRKYAKGSLSLGGNVNLRSPFTNFENIIGSIKYGSDPAQHSTNGKLQWGDKKQITSVMTLKKPVRLSNLQLDGSIKTPFKGFRNIALDLVHKFHRGLSTSVKGSIDKETAKLSILGRSLKNGYKGDMKLKSSIKNAEAMALTFSHTGSDGSYDSNVEMNHNGKVYGYDLKMSHSGNGWQRKTNGDLMLTLNKQKVNTNWNHENTDDSLKSALSSKWGNKRFSVDLTGSHKLSDLRNINGVLKIKSPWKPVQDLEFNMDHENTEDSLKSSIISKWNGKSFSLDLNGLHRLSDLRNINGVLRMKSPWKPVRDIEFNIDHKHGEGLLNSIAFLRQGENKKASSKFNFNKGQNNADFDFELVSPYHEDLSGKLRTNFEEYPMTTSGEFKWAPRMKGTFDGSLSLPSWDDADLNMKLTTPHRSVRNLVLKASNKKEGGELLSHLNLDYGMRQNIDMESRIANEEDKKMIRIKLNTPFEQMKSLDTGLNFHGHANKFDTNADFELLPLLGKFDGAINWELENEMHGKIRLDTPFPEYPYFELSASNILNGHSKKFHIQSEHYPNQVFSLDSTYAFDLPLSFDATLRSPYPEFDDVGLSFQHSMTDSSFKSNGDIRYQPTKKIEANVNADWTSDIEAGIEVKTPFTGYEQNKITMRHRGQLNNFDSHGEIDVAQQNIAADASFKSGYTTTGTFTFTSPIPGLEKIDFSLKKKGNKKNIRGSAVMKIDENKYETTFNNKLTQESLKSAFTVKTPYTETFKFGFDHSGPLLSFTNKISINYGRKVDIDTIATFDLRDNDVNGNGILKYKLSKGRNTARISFSKSGSIDDLSFTASSGLNRDQVTLIGSLKTKEGIESNVQIKTPFKGFRNTGMTLSHSGPISDCNCHVKISYMDGKDIESKLEFSNLAGKGIKFSSDLTTPFRSFESTSAKFNHEMNAFSGDITGNGEFTTTVGGFGTGDVAYRKTGDLNDLTLKGSASVNGKEHMAFTLTNNFQETEVHSKCGLKSSLTPDILLSIDHSGDSLSFSTKTMGRVGNNMVSTDSTMKQGYNSINADSSLTYKLQGFGKNKASISLKKDSDLDNCNMGLTVKFNDEEAKVSASRSGELNNMHFSGSASLNGDEIDVSGSWKNTEDIEGTLKVSTPFEEFRTFGLGMTHTGGMADFTSSVKVDLMDGKSINGKVELAANTWKDITFMSDLTTPIEGFTSLNLKFNNKYDTYNSEMNGNAAIDTTIKGFGTAGITYSKTGGLDNMKVNGDVKRNGREIGVVSINNALLDQELHSSFEFKSTETPHVRLTLDHNGDFSNLKSSAKAVVGKNIILGEALLNQRGDIFDAEGKLLYVLEKIGSNEASLTVHKEGEANNFNVELTGKFGGKESKITGNFKNADELTGDLTLNTPMKGYKNVGLSFKHDGSNDRLNSEGKVVLVDGKEFVGTVNFYRYLNQRIEFVFELNTPITDFEFTKYEYRHEGQSDSFTCFSSLQYGKANRMTYDLVAKSSPKPEITSTLKINEAQALLISGSYENTWPKYGFTGKYEVGLLKDFFITVDSSLDASDDIVGSLSISTSGEGFNNVGMNFEHSLKSNGIRTEGKVTYMDGKVISGKAEARMGKTASQISLELATPFEGYEQMKYESKVVRNRRLYKVTSKVVYGDNQKINMEAYSKFKPYPEISLTISSPLAQDIEVFVSLDKSWPKCELICKLSPGNGQEFTLDGTFDATKDISGSLKIGTPLEDFKNVGVNFVFSGHDLKFVTEASLNYKTGKEIFGKFNFYRYMWQRVDSSLEVTTPFVGMENTKFEINFEDNTNGISTTAALDYNNGEKLNGNIKVTHSPNYEVLVTINTPFNDYNVIRTQATLDLTAPTYEAMWSLNCGNKASSIDSKFSLFSTEHMEGSVEVNTPLEGLEYTKAEYHHKADSNEVEGSLSLTYDNGKKISCDVKTDLSPRFDGTITVKTPFNGFEKMEAAATYEKSYKKYQTSSSLDLGQGNIFSMSSELDYSIEPIKASTKINTPFTNLRNVELDITHEGSLTNFKTTGFLSSPLTDHVNAKASLRYDAIMDMSAAASLQSPLPGCDDLRVELKTSELPGEMKTHALFGWTSGEQIAYEGLFQRQSGWNEDRMHADISITSPFVAIQNVNMQMEHSAQTDSYTEKMNFELNGDSLLDFDTEFHCGDKHSAELLVRKPWPMQYTASKATHDGAIDAEISANWNRDEQNSNIRVQASVADKSDSYQTEKALDVSVAYAARKVGVVHKFSDKSSELTSNGYLFWDSDDDSKISYDFQMSDSSRRRKQILDGSFKLGLPTRTLGFTGSYSKNAASVNTNGVFSWDAGRDDTKQVGLKTIISHGDSLKGDITLIMPSVRKEIRVNGEVMLNNGRVILDTQTDISYSKDSRKTLTLTSKLEDISTHYSHFNYSLALGVKHPYTNVDIGINSHIGSSDESMTVGMATNYLTSKRQMKNLALLSEINLLKKRISVQVSSPLNNIEVVGNVVSETPFKVNLVNKIDDEENVRADMTIDTQKKTFKLNALTKTDTLSISAMYPNKTAFHADFSHNDNVEEALLAVRLNTSRLMHTRLSWRPDMMQRFKRYALPRAIQYTGIAMIEFTNLNQAVAEEITSKYSDITKEMVRELRPFISALNDELSIVADAMTELSKQLEEMYKRNDYYIQNMGDGALQLQQKLRTLSLEYRTTYSERISSMRAKLNSMRRYPIGVYYTKFVTEGAEQLVREAYSSLQPLNKYMAEVDSALKEYKASILAMKEKALNTIYNATYVDYITNKVNNIDISPYISSFNIPEEYTNVVYDVPSKINAKLNDVLDGYKIKEGLNEVYQQGVWAYNYWQLEENLEKHAKSILNTLKEIIEEEIKEFSEDLDLMIRNPITVWDPEHGEIQADIPLPIAVKQLDQVPDVTPLLVKAEEFAIAYLPDRGTWDNLVKSTSDLWPSKSENQTVADLEEQLKEYRPSKNFRRKGRHYRVKMAARQ